MDTPWFVANIRRERGMSWPVWATNFWPHQKSPSPKCSWRMKMFLASTRVFMSRLSLVGWECLFLSIDFWFFLSLALLLLNQTWTQRESVVRPLLTVPKILNSFLSLVQWFSLLGASLSQRHMFWAYISAFHMSGKSGFSLRILTCNFLSLEMWIPIFREIKDLSPTQFLAISESLM